MPLNIDIVQVLLHMLNFVILAGGLTLILFNPVRKFINERQKRFEEQETENRKNAEEYKRLKEEYEAKLVAFEEETAAARVQAERDAADIAKKYIDSSRAEAAAIISKAEQDAEKRKEQILDSAQTEIGELVNLIINQNFVPVVDDRNVLMGIVTRRRVMQELFKN